MACFGGSGGGRLGIVCGLGIGLGTERRGKTGGVLGDTSDEGDSGISNN